ncbi:MAG: DUF1573 domain-containing protein [Bacteroidales bacterium]|nr:DUF1573 domain-containing protein [Bacteroidales bacterium]
MINKVLGVIIIASFLIPAGLFAQVETEKNDKKITNYYRQDQGNLKFHSNRTQLRGITNTETRTDSIEFYNNWDKPMTLKLKETPSHIKAKLSTDLIQPEQEGKIYITYDARIKNDYGQCVDYLKLLTSDTLMPEKRLVINPVIKEDFSVLTPEERANAPKIVIDEKEFDFGEVKVGVKVEHDFSFRNEGKSDLIIRKTKAGCGCTATKPEKTVLKPGESSKITLIFNTARRSGKQNKSVTVTINDPEQPTIILRMKGTIIK